MNIEIKKQEAALASVVRISHLHNLYFRNVYLIQVQVAALATFPHYLGFWKFMF
jgi:hypothetical protein